MLIVQKPAPGMPVSFVLDGTEYTLRFPLKVLKQLEKDHHIGILRGGSGMAEAFGDAEKLALILAAGLRTKQPHITVDWVEENIDSSMLMDLAPALIYAANGRWRDIGESPNLEAREPTARASTGSQSGPSDDTTLAYVNGTSGD